MILAKGPRLTIEVPTAAPAAPAGRSSKLTDVEKEHIRSILESTAWRIRGAGGRSGEAGTAADDAGDANSQAGARYRPKR